MTRGGSRLTRVRSIKDEKLEREALAVLELGGLPGLGPRRMERLFGEFGSWEAALRAPESIFTALVGGRAASARGSDANRSEAIKVLEECQRTGTDVLVRGSRLYPASLEGLPDPPPVLFGLGDLSLLDRPMVAVVGTRNPSDYGVSVARELGRAIGEAGGVVVSGLALGIDVQAHLGALDSSAVNWSGGTIAVLGSGVDVATPVTNERVYRRIIESGLVLSEFLPGAPSRPHHFPQRNRVIAGLAEAIVVVEAGERSGALITTDHGLELGRDVYAVPGEIRNPQSRGTNALLRDGARPLIGIQEFLEGFRWASELNVDRDARREPATDATSPVQAPPADLVPSGREVWDLLGPSPVHVDVLSAHLGLPTSKVLSTLAALEMGGWVVGQPGMRFSRFLG